MDYQAFLQSKRTRNRPVGFDPPASLDQYRLFDWQEAIVRWALRLGRAALWEDCGLGKTLQQLAWADQVCRHTLGDVLILAPLSVAAQTRREGEKFGIGVTVCRSREEVRPGINITNYEMLRHFDASRFVGVVLDESSILKSFMGQTKRAIIEAFAGTPYRLACTATPAPNDHMELGNHAEFLGVPGHNEMLARYFINDASEAGTYRLKKHAEGDFWRWVASWAVSLARPSDLGYEDAGFALPPLAIHEEVVEVDLSDADSGFLFRMPSLNATGLHRELRRTAEARAVRVAEIVRRGRGPWVVWCHTDYESDALQAVMPDAVDLRGSEKATVKERKLIDFADGRIGVLVTKPSVAGFGMNWQHAHNMAFVGLSYSYEQFYQAVRRCWRFGQKETVNCHVVLAETEGAVLRTILRKQEEHQRMQKSMSKAMSEVGLRIEAPLELSPVAESFASGEGWDLHLGDCCQTVKRIADDSVHLTITSPPFENLYVYSDSEADMGNSADSREFFDHFRFLISELLRITVPGRLACIHCKDLPLYRGRDGAMGLRDFPGEIVRAFVECGWTFHSRVTIWKCPVTEMQRTKNHGLLYKNLRADSCGSRQGMADYVLVFRKWVDGLDKFPEPVPHTKDEFPLEQWQEWASPVWWTVNQMDVLNYKEAKADQDEKHICPLQLDVISRCLHLWSNPGDLVFDPFNGIGSTGYEAVRHGRRYAGIELKPSYFRQAQKHLTVAASEANAPTLDLA